MRIGLARAFWIGAAGIVVLAALIALAAIVRGSFSGTDARILITLAALLYAGGVGIAGLALAERPTAPFLGTLVAVASPFGLALLLWAIWSFVDEGDNEPQLKLAWSAVIALLAGLVSTTALLLARRPSLARLAVASAALTALAAALSIAGIWAGDSDSSFLKALAALWILATVSYFLVPILGRFSSAAASAPELRVLAELDGVELVATHSNDGLEFRLRPGERLALRRRL